MTVPGALLGRWGYGALFVAVFLGSLGAPIPEDGVFLAAGYLAGEGRLSLPSVVAIGVTAAMAGDNLGYWLGRRFGHAAVERAVGWARVPPARVAQFRRLVLRYGVGCVFLARFVSGARLLVGPLAGSAGLPPLTFLGANALAALIYVPLMAGAGYALCGGAGKLLERLHRWLGPLWLATLFAATAGTLLIFGRRIARYFAGREK